jgi:glycosyltransferase involved in cell wall biosynthesis
MFEHIGIVPDWLPQMINELGLENNFLAHGFKPYLEVMQTAAELDFLLATSEKNFKGPHYCLPSKIFDYLEFRKPVLAFVTEGSQKEFFRNSGNGIIFNPDNIAENVMELIRIFNSPLNLKLNNDFLSNYHRYKITGQLAQLI